MIKLLCSYFLFILPFQLASADQFTDLTLKTISQCYDKYEIIGPEFVKCISDRMEPVDNPRDYKLKVNSDYHEKSKEGKMTIFMIDHAGYMMYCIATAGPKLIIKSCAHDKGKPLTQEQELALPNLLD